MKRKRTRRLSKRQRRVLVEATTSDGCHAKLALDIQPPLHSGDRITLSGKGLAGREPLDREVDVAEA
jgi:hypothetical protein